MHELYLLHEYKNFGWEDMNFMIPFELDIIMAEIRNEKDKLDKVSDAGMSVAMLENLPSGTEI